MDDVWFGPGLTRDDFDAFLRALSLHAKSRPPLLAVATGHDADAKLVMASRALFGLFGVTTSEALSHRLLGGHDPGAKRLATLFHMLPLEDAPRLERLRFFVGPGSEIITFLCRRMPMATGTPVFIAAALGVRAGLIPTVEPGQAPTSEIEAPEPVTLEPIGAAATPVAAARTEANGPEASASVQTLQLGLRTRWPAKRTVRFVWQTDADGVCTQVTPPLADVVGDANADLVNRNLLELAPTIDPSGRLAEALGARATWGALDVNWPITDAPAAVTVGLGAIPAFDRDRVFEGYRGYGVIHLDRLVAREPVHFPPRPGATGAGAVVGNVVPFRGGQKGLSPEDQIAFDALGVELRDQAGLNEPEEQRQAVSEDRPMILTGTDRPAAGPSGDSPSPVALADSGRPTPDIPEPTPPGPEASRVPMAGEPPGASAITPLPPPVLPASPPTRADEIGRNGLAVLDRLALGLLISRDNVPIFANRHLLDMLGFSDEDALHAAGGMTHLFGDQPGNVTGSEAVGVRCRDGAILPTNARMQRIDWDGLPATLLTLQHNPDAGNAEKTERAAEIEAITHRYGEARHRDESELRELRAILETATDGVAVIDAQCNVLSLNRSGEALFGRDRGTVIGKPFLGLFAQDNQNLATDYFEGLKSNATKSLLNDGREILVKAHQGGTIPVFMTLGRLEPSGATTSGEAAEGARFCALFRDLTHWKKVEQELDGARKDAERASALKSDFLAKVSHEVRTPLNAIIGFAEVIMEERFGPIGNDRYKDYLRDIHASGTHVMSLVNDLLDLSKIEAGKMELAVTAIDANKVIAECVGIMQPQASRERVIMRLSLAPHLPRIKADERSLRQIVLNLLSNAVKFNEPGGQVIVATAAPEDGKVVIRIRDTGPGMSEADIAAALEPFRQLATTRPMATGTGLGLPLTKALVEANEAAFTIRSKVDQGTLVEVAFPPARVLAV